MTAVLETDRLTKRYGTARGIEEVSISVERGEVHGFLGPNGAGKTTTIRTLLDLLHPTSGRATLFGLDSQEQSRQIHARIGNLPGDFACDPRLTGWEFLEFCAQARGMSGLGIGSLLAQRFEADLDRSIGELSRGNRQKIGLFQALFHDPELLMLDEPTTGRRPGDEHRGGLHPRRDVQPDRATSDGLLRDPGRQRRHRGSGGARLPRHDPLASGLQDRPDRRQLPRRRGGLPDDHGGDRRDDVHRRACGGHRYLGGTGRGRRDGRVAAGHVLRRVAALASGVLHSARAVTGLSVGLLVAMYALDVAGRLASGLDPIRWISAFRYYGAPMREGIDPASFIGLTAAGTLLLITGARLLERRDVLH